ncbi:hypothetical protein QR680_018450 [Steinernema hermaphroditum]|uniref:FHA domain-containing protein n=1 Tax=Steinernema hermaphroditum TaxID=289476 RepID=A0AA39HI06_9BILA|nr:hypothetical protein QR680_018450 [Steinernema hermaphroditum]
MLSVESTDDPPLGSFVFETNGDSVSIGRNATKCAIFVGAKSAGVSKVHIRLTLETEEMGAPFLRVEETNTYGTVFNGKRWKAPMVRAGDRFLVGKCAFEVKSLMEDDKTPPPEDFDDLEEGVEEESRVAKRRLEDEMAPVETAKRWRGEDEEDRFIGSLWADDGRFSTHPSELAENRRGRAKEKNPEAPDPSKTVKSAKKKLTDIRHFLGESQKTVASTVSNPRVLAPESVIGSQTQRPNRQTRADHLSGSDDDDFVESTPDRNAIRAKLLPVSQITVASRVSNGKILAPDSARGSQTQRSTRSTRRQTRAHNVTGDDDVVELTPQRNAQEKNSVIDPEESLFNDIHDREDGHTEVDMFKSHHSEEEDVMSTRSTRILAPESPPPRSVISVAETVASCVVPESVAPEAAAHVDIDGFTIPELPPTKSAKRKAGEKATNSKRIKLKDANAEAIMPSTAVPQVEIEDNEQKPDLAMGLTQQEIIAIHEKSICVMSLCRSLKKQASLTSSSSAESTTSSRSRQVNYKRFHKAAQGVYRHLSLDECSPLGSYPSERTFVHVV